MESFAEGARDGSRGAGVGDVCLICLEGVERLDQGDRRGIDERSPLQGAIRVAVVGNESDDGAAVSALLWFPDAISAHADTFFRETCCAYASMSLRVSSPRSRAIASHVLL